MIPAIVSPKEQPAGPRTRERPASPKRAARKKYDAQKTRGNILSVATREFARNGYNGARIDAIAARTSTTKRMIYYYFGDKEGLYGRVLEEAYREVRAGEQNLELDHLPPLLAVIAGV